MQIILREPMCRVLQRWHPLPKQRKTQGQQATTAARSQPNRSPASRCAMIPGDRKKADAKERKKKRRTSKSPRTFPATDPASQYTSSSSPAVAHNSHSHSRPSPPRLRPLPPALQPTYSMWRWANPDRPSSRDSARSSQTPGRETPLRLVSSCCPKRWTNPSCGMRLLRHCLVLVFANGRGHARMAKCCGT